MKNIKTLCLFLPTGRTFTFKDVVLTTNNETVLVFDYRAMSDGEGKTMTVFRDSIVGYSIMSEDEELPF